MLKKLLNNAAKSLEQLVVTEKFSRYSDSQILYRFTVEDPTVFSEPFTGEMMMGARPATEPLYEYACHEGSSTVNL